MTRPDIEGIRGRAEAATEGPWMESGQDVIAVLYRERIATAFKRMFSRERYDAAANAAFIAHARADIPALLAYVAELENVPKLSIEDVPRDVDLETASEAEKAAINAHFRRFEG